MSARLSDTVRQAAAEALPELARALGGKAATVPSMEPVNAIRVRLYELGMMVGVHSDTLTEAFTTGFERAKMQAEAKNTPSVTGGIAAVLSAERRREREEAAAERKARAEATDTDRFPDERPGDRKTWISDADLAMKRSYTFGRDVTAAGENDELRQERQNEREKARAQLVKWGVMEPGDRLLPDDVDEAINRLTDAWATWELNDNRAFALAPGAYVVGPSAAARTSQSARDRAERLREKGSEALDKARARLAKVLGKYDPRRKTAIRSDDADALDKLRERVAKLEAEQELMKAANKVARSKKLDEAAKIAELGKLGIREATAAKLLNPREAYLKPGFQAYELTNNNANIKRLQGRIVELEKLAARAETAPSEYVFDGGTVEDDADAGRVRIYFDDKPDADTRGRMKRNGWKWSRQNMAWQRLRTAAALQDALRLTGAAAEKPARRVEIMPQTRGKATRVVFVPGKIAEEGYYLVDNLSRVQASHNPDCSVNSGHRIPAAQPRDRSGKDLCRQADKIAAVLDPTIIAGTGTEAFSGPPVVNLAGDVIQGNGRAISLRVAYERYPDQAAAYKRHLVEHAERFGVDAEAVRAMPRPVLVRVIEVTNARAVELGNVLNTAEAVQAPLDKAKAIVRRLSEQRRRGLGRELAALMDAAGDDSTLRAALDQPRAVELLDYFDGLDRSGLVKDGQLTTQGKDLFRDVLLGLVFDDGTPGSMARYESLSHTARMGIERAIGSLITFVGTPHDLSPRLRASAEIARRAAVSGGAMQRAEDVLAQRDAFDTAAFSADDVPLANLLMLGKTQKEIAERFRVYAALAQGYTTLFESVPPQAPADAFRAAFVERVRLNPAPVGGALAWLGYLDRLSATSGRDVIEYQADDTGRGATDLYLFAAPDDGGTFRLLAVPTSRVRAVRGPVGGSGAELYETWAGRAEDADAFEVDLSGTDALGKLAKKGKRTRLVGSGVNVRYRSDKLIQTGDRKGKVNTYTHDFDSGQRPVFETGPASDPVLVITRLAVDRRGILN